MAQSKKRAAPTAASQRPAKKRKSAEASLVKMKEIVEAEDASSEDEKEEAKALLPVTNAADEESDVDVNELKDHEVVAEEELPVVAPGFRLWETKSKLASKGELTQISKYDAEKEEHTHILKIKHNEAFKLMPLMVTQGPYQGSYVFMLQPQSGFFRFMDFPPEIRNMIYASMLEADGPIQVATRKRVNEPKTPWLAATYPDGEKRVEIRDGCKLPTTLNILRTSKQILKEAAPVLYGNNSFRFHELGDLRVFLDRIGSMRPYVRHLYINSHGWYRSKAKNAFKLLKDATQLRTLAFNHSDVCAQGIHYYLRYITTPERLVDSLYIPFRALQKAHTESGSTINVLDILNLYWKRCVTCEAAKPDFATEEECKGAPCRYPWIDNACKVKCKDAEKHCEEVQKKIRGLVARDVGVRI